MRRQPAEHQWRVRDRLSDHITVGLPSRCRSDTDEDRDQEADQAVRASLAGRRPFRRGLVIFLAFSPEREDPGNADYNTTTIPKVIGGDGREALDLAKAFYGSFVRQIVPVSSPNTAEAVKLTENIFRAVNIALVNELKIIFSKMGIDVWEVIEAAKTKPFGLMPFYPGPGLGCQVTSLDVSRRNWIFASGRA